jgi:type IV secretory pathway VirD2 relaxase
MPSYVRRFMAQVEKDVGRRLDWAAVNHHDTDNPHAHIVVRGVDGDGLPVRFDREYIANGMRARAQELATLDLGPRTQLDLQRARSREVLQDRFTSLDRDIGRLHSWVPSAHGAGRLSLLRPRSLAPRWRDREASAVARRRFRTWLGPAA